MFEKCFHLKAVAHYALKIISFIQSPTLSVFSNTIYCSSGAISLTAICHSVADYFSCKNWCSGVPITLYSSTQTSTFLCFSNRKRESGNIEDFNCLRIHHLIAIHFEQDVGTNILACISLNLGNLDTMYLEKQP